MTKTTELANKTEVVNLANPTDILNFATNLKDLIVSNKLYTDIKGKNYVNVEGWQIAGAFTGAIPIVEVVENQSTGTIYKYRAEVSLRDKDGNKIGYGVAVCSNKEAGKHNFDEYAVCSMAQTRAIGKAYRMKLGWLLKVAGYETTPAEEMDAVAAKEAEVVDKQHEKSVQKAKDELGKAQDIEELKQIYLKIGTIRYDKEVTDYKDSMKKILQGD